MGPVRCKRVFPKSLLPRREKVRACPERSVRDEGDRHPERSEGSNVLAFLGVLLSKHFRFLAALRMTRGGDLYSPGVENGKTLDSWLSSWTRVGLDREGWADHNTLWRFYKDHRQATRSLFKRTVRTAVAADLVDQGEVSGPAAGQPFAGLLPPGKVPVLS